jgi:hypothetical protein
MEVLDMSRTTTEEMFWAGGSPDGWFVAMHREPVVHPGKPEEVGVRWFHSRDFAEGELGAARTAEALAQRLNAALEG